MNNGSLENLEKNAFFVKYNNINLIRYAKLLKPACLHFCKRKVLLIILLQVNIKDLSIFSAQTLGLS